jgi:hypothetical protein
MALSLAWNFRFEDLYRDEGLERLDRSFVEQLASRDAPLAGRLQAARAAVDTASPPTAKDEAALLIDLAPHVEAFVGALFSISEELADLKAMHDALEPLYRVKWKFVKRQAMLKVPVETLVDFDGIAAEHTLQAWLGTPFDELLFARAVLEWQEIGWSAQRGVDQHGQGHADQPDRQRCAQRRDQPRQDVETREARERALRLFHCACPATMGPSLRIASSRSAILEGRSKTACRVPL